MKTTESQKEYWKSRKINWEKSYSSTAMHPHRGLILSMLRTFGWRSLFEIGCASGPNLIRIHNAFPNKDIGGIDINQDAIDEANRTFSPLLKMNPPKNALFMCGSADDILMSDASTDVVLSDMMLIYVGPRAIHKYLDEIHRVTRRWILFIEFYHPNPLRRLWLYWKRGYFAHNWKKLLAKHGFRDIMVQKLPPGAWPRDATLPMSMWTPGEPQKTYAYIVTAKKN